MSWNRVFSNNAFHFVAEYIIAVSFLLLMQIFATWKIV